MKDTVHYVRSIKDVEYAMPKDGRIAQTKSNSIAHFVENGAIPLCVNLNCINPRTVLTSYTALVNNYNEDNEVMLFADGEKTITCRFGELKSLVNKIIDFRLGKENDIGHEFSHNIVGRVVAAISFSILLDKSPEKINFLTIDELNYILFRKDKDELMLMENNKNYYLYYKEDSVNKIIATACELKYKSNIPLFWETLINIETLELNQKGLRLTSKFNK